MRKRLCWLVVIVLIIALLPLGGCGKKKADDTGSTGTPSTPSTPTTPTTPVVTPSNPVSALLQKGMAIQNLSFEGTLGSGQASYSVKGWVLGKKTRLDRTIGDQTTCMIYDFDSKVCWTWVKDTKTGFKSEVPEMAYESPVFWAQALVDFPYKTLDQGEANGMKCSVAGFDYGSANQSVNLKLWIANDSGLPVKMQGNFGGIDMGFDYKKLSTEAPAADLVVPPSNVTFSEVPK